MPKLCYKPEDAWCGDCMPFYWNGKFWIYHQRDKRNPVPLNGDPICWSLASTSDFIHYQDHGDSLLCGNYDEQDQFIYAGSVMEKDGLFHAYYTGYNRDYIGTGKPSQVIMHATSKNLVRWDKIKEERIYPPTDGYEIDDWRDPFVFFDEERGRYIMLLAARKLKGHKIRRGVTVYLTSKDLTEWKFEGDFWAPELYYTHEMPDIFKIGEYWYFVYSEYSDKKITRYRMSKSLKGPWMAPDDDAFDGRAYYAARTATDGQKRYLFGWVPTRANNYDKNLWQWGGILMVQEVYQREDKTLGVRCPEAVEAAFRDEKCADAALPVRVSSVDGRGEAVLFNETGDFFRMDISLAFKEGTKAIGIKLFENTEEDRGYEYTLLPPQDRLLFDRTPNIPWVQCFTTGLERPVQLVPGTQYNLMLIVDEEICVLYVNGVALSARMYNKPGKSIVVYVNNGEVEILSARLYQNIMK